VGNPEACVGRTDKPSSPEQRLVEAYRRYDLAYRSAPKPGTRAAVELARARLDLTLLLQALDEPLPDALLDQLGHDAESLVRATPPLTIDVRGDGS
jgi:hypothetical protein